ncbi:hypothetical protein Tco_0167569 [Tanacetum coccineum]
MKECFFVEEHKSNLLYTYGIGGIELPTEVTSYTIPYVSYVPEININVLSMKQLILQGFEVEIIGDKCNITHMFNHINGKKDNKSQSERMEDGLNGQDQIEVNGKMVSLKVHTIEEFIQFMELMNTNKISYKHKEYPEGLGTFKDQGEGRKPNKYTEGLGTFKDQGEGRKPNKYTKGMGTFKDQAKGLLDHFRTSAAGMDIASKHASTNKALKEIKKEDDVPNRLKVTRS